MPLPRNLAPILRETQDLRAGGVFRLLAQAALVGGGAGAVIGAFRFLYTWTNAHIAALLGRVDCAAPLSVCVIFGTLLALALLAGRLVRWEPLLSGSGIPQVELAVAGRLPLPWLRVLLGKFAGTWISLTGGLSVGREGPCIQMGAAVGRGVGHLWPGGHPDAPRYLIAGGVAGLTAAFGAPLAGMFFAFEEMKSIVTVPLLLFTGTAAATAWLVVDGLFGFGLVFPFAAVAALRWEQLWLALPLGLALGAFGACYNALLLGATRRFDRQRLLPPALKPVLPFLCSGLLLYVYPQVLAGVGVSVTDLGQPALSLAALALLLLVKVAFSAFSFASGVPGGLLMPMLGVGALCGACAAALGLACAVLDASQTAALLVLSMGGMFAATVRAPLTGAALVLEMTAAWSCLPELCIVVPLATFTANRLGSVPVYDALKQRILGNLPPSG